MNIPLFNIYGEDMSVIPPKRVTPLTESEIRQIKIMDDEISYLRGCLAQVENTKNRIFDREPKANP